ncbi:putative amidase PB8B6.03 [Mycena kentingensis (nom. inval.)]|nr:putative amidase PB8B6.03 [Mycena kentingensis (nom. inval.)]
MWPFRSECELRAQTKLTRRAELLSVASAYSSDSAKFLKATASEIVENIRKGEWTASQVVNAFISRSVEAQDKTNCITEVLFKEAREQAQLLDEEFMSTKQLVGPLHGVPVSIKDQFHIAGFDASIGRSDYLDKPSTTDGDIVATLKAAGAIPIVKTNVPQTLLSFECSNPVFGRTINPYGPRYTSGGSSGGESALLAMDGSVLGVGSDIGGSLRCPATFCGIYSLKPGPSRISYYGATSPAPGFDGIVSVAGPMARSLSSLATWTGARPILDQSTTSKYSVEQLSVLPDAALPSLRFHFANPRSRRNCALVITSARRCIAKFLCHLTYTSDHYVKASPAVKRAVLETVAAVRANGHECVEINIPTPADAFKSFVAISSADGYRTLLENGAGSDPLDRSLISIANGPNWPRFIRYFVSWVVGFFFGDKQLSGTLGTFGTKSVKEYWEWTKRRDEYNVTFYQEVWDEYELDGIIAPVLAMPQIPNGTFAALFSLSAGTTVYNLVNSPAGCVPVTHIDPLKDALTEEWTKSGTKSLAEKLMYEGKKPFYDPVAMKGMPVGVQVVGRKWEEEKVLAMMRVVDDALGPRGFGPGSWDAKVQTRI